MHNFPSSCGTSVWIYLLEFSFIVCIIYMGLTDYLLDNICFSAQTTSCKSTQIPDPADKITTIKELLY